MLERGGGGIAVWGMLKFTIDQCITNLFKVVHSH